MPDTDANAHQQLLTRLAGGDSAALGALFDSFSPRILGLAFTILCNRQDAEEVMQETWMQVWKSARDYDPNLGSVATWVLRVTRSRAIDRLRSRIRSQARETAVAMAATVAGFETPAPASDDLPGSGQPLEFQLGVTSSAVIGSALVNLPPEQREAIEMAFLRGLSREEIAASQSVAIGTVKTRIFLGLKRIREGLAAAPSASR